MLVKVFKIICKCIYNKNMNPETIPEEIQKYIEMKKNL